MAVSVESHPRTFAPPHLRTSGGLRIVFFGTPEFAVPSLQRLISSRHDVVGVVTQPDRPRGRGQRVSDSPVKAAAQSGELAVLQPARLREPDVADTIRTWAPDLGVVVAYGKLIPESLLAIPRLGMINVHASLLPKYRGAAPVHRAVIDGAAETGVTIIRVAAVLDSGNMFAKTKRPIGPDETSDDVERDLAGLGASLLITVVEDLAAGRAVEEPQDDMLSTYAARLTKDEGLVDWTLPAVYIHNRVRGLYPWPHAYTYLDGSRVILLRTRVDSSSTTESPGTVVDASNERLHVATGHSGVIAIEDLQLEGRRAMNTREFLAGHPIHPGARFGSQ
jgi:methionyl-tRNA formyltransferase